MTPPTIAPPFELLPFGGAVGDGDPVGDALTEDMYYTPDAPKIVSAPYSELSI